MARVSHRTTIVALLAAMISLLLVVPAQADHGSSGSTSVSADDRSSLELVAEDYMLEAHDDQRAAGNTRNGVRYGDVGRVGGLQGWSDVTTVARRWADTLTFDAFRHNPDYARQYGHWTGVGENIAIRTVQPARNGVPSASQVRAAAEKLMQSWWESDGHRSNWMRSNWDHVGVGAALTRQDVGFGEDYWVLAAVANFRDHDGSGIDGRSFAPGTTPLNESEHGSTSTTTSATSGGSSFSDVPRNHTFSSNIEALLASGVTKGCGDGRFCPDDHVTRGQMAAFLTRALDLPAGTSSFRDTRGHLFEKPAASLARSAITRGCGNDNFCPDAKVTRGQMAAFLVRALDLPAGSATFTDTGSSVFRRDVAALASSGITKGCGGGRFCPDAYVTRAQMAAFLDRAGLLG